MDEQLNLRNFDWLSLSDFDGISVDLIQVEENIYNVILTPVVALDDDYTITGGLTMETQIYTSTPIEAYNIVYEIAELGLFPSELIFANGVLHSAEGDHIRDIDWLKEIDTSTESV